MITRFCTLTILPGAAATVNTVITLSTVKYKKLKYTVNEPSLQYIDVLLPNNNILKMVSFQSCQNATLHHCTHFFHLLLGGPSKSHRAASILLARRPVLVK